jgi:hypothetical protein
MRTDSLWDCSASTKPFPRLAFSLHADDIGGAEWHLAGRQPSL